MMIYIIRQSSATNSPAARIRFVSLIIAPEGRVHNPVLEQDQLILPDRLSRQLGIGLGLLVVVLFPPYIAFPLNINHR